jgi:hypothetical protein
MRRERAAPSGWNSSTQWFASSSWAAMGHLAQSPFTHQR